MSFLSNGTQSVISSIIGILRGGSLVAGIEVSVIISEGHILTAQATKQALESGTQVTDHIILDPITVTVNFEITNTSFWRMSAKDAFETFKKMLEKRELFELITEHYTYDNMALVNLTADHAAPYKGRIQCTATFQRVNQVKLQTVGREEKKLAPSKSGSPGKTGAAEVNAGVQKAQPVSEGSWLEKAIFGKNEAVNGSALPGMPAEVRPPRP